MIQKHRLDIGWVSFMYLSLVFDEVFVKFGIEAQIIQHNQIIKAREQVFFTLDYKRIRSSSK